MKVTKFSIQLSKEAELDFDSSFGYYFKDNPKVANTFFRKINLGFEDIGRNPFAFSVIYKDVRKYVVQKFPFVIYYQIEKSTIKIVAIFHTSRNPEIWNDRV